MIFSKIEIIDGEQYVKIDMLENEIAKIKDLQQRIDKAIEYIDKHTNNDNCESKNILDLTDRDNILLILKGEDKKC